MVKITVTYTYDCLGSSESGQREVVWVREGQNAYYDFDPEDDTWRIRCDDKILVVNTDTAQLISVELEGENEDKFAAKKAKKK